MKPKADDTKKLVEQIRADHKWRRYWIKVQQKLDRAMESFVRINNTQWTEAETEADRKREAAKALAIVKAAKDGEGSVDMLMLVSTTLAARKPADDERNVREKNMEKLAKQLPVYPFVEGIHGAAALGLATIIGEAGNLSDYRNAGKLWNRLGFAPYDGLAGSTWKREKWRHRALTKEEWIEHPFSGERYALMHQIAIWLVNTQVEGKEKSGTKHGRAKGPYGEAYIHRRERTDAAHPDWSPMRGRMDAIRYVMKRFLRDLWVAWRKDDKNFKYMPWEERSAA